MLHLIRIIALVLCVVLARAENQIPDSAKLNEFHQKEEEAKRFTTLSMYRAAVNEWILAIEIAKSEGMDEQYLDASISLAELLRKTADYERALGILYDLKATKRYPKIHVRKLGRLAAVYHEIKLDPKFNQVDSVKFYTNEALALAIEFGLKAEEASLKNELGFLISRNLGPGKGIPLLLEASSIFKELNDTLGYIRAQTHLLNDYLDLGLRQKEDSTIRELVVLIEGRNWYAAEIDLYNIISYVYLQRGDSSKYYRWSQKVDIATVNYYKAINTEQMAAFRIFHDTKKYQEDAEESKTIAQRKAKELEEQRSRTRELTLYISILGLFILLVVGLFFRERQLKAKMDHINIALNEANDKYQMLMVESNHRIKNNLQMVISMLQYSSKEVGDSNTYALKRISGKIHTISALHKHLYLDVHNERVDLNTYFKEIIGLYEEIVSDDFTVEKAIENVGIKSERIVYFGLIFNEMLSNTIEHGKMMQKKVKVEVIPIEDHYLFRYQDGSEFQINNTKGMGSQLIEQLIKRIDGKNFVFEPSLGLYQFTFHV